MILEIRGQEVKTKSTIPSEIRGFICIFKSENVVIASFPLGLGRHLVH
ncbi:hypothetical protein BpHYR1_043952 [Brachionus plicatilis]|uniref:Uncharacterized protein n=1 Tax=Brachionus plicatilis TaxID=10195 RepID=A0A3M7P2D7_BRAPC|nr:hypothetical protein BpHYR1_043952 [Brachionus plicatilis]